MLPKEIETNTNGHDEHDEQSMQDVEECEAFEVLEQQTDFPYSCDMCEHMISRFSDLIHVQDTDFDMCMECWQKIPPVATSMLVSASIATRVFGQPYLPSMPLQTPTAEPDRSDDDDKDDEERQERRTD